jgi:hypothetical protein
VIESIDFAQIKAHFVSIEIGEGHPGAEAHLARAGYRSAFRIGADDFFAMQGGH